MSAPSIHRVPAGNGVNSGRFAPTGHADSGLELGAEPAGPTITHRTPMVEAITGLAQDHCDGADGDLYKQFRTYAAALPEAEARTHWDRLTGATANRDRFADPDTGEDAAEEALESEDLTLTGGRCLSDYESVNEADRPDENEYIGFDFPQAAEDLTAHWENQVDLAAIDAVTAVSAASPRLAVTA